MYRRWKSHGAWVPSNVYLDNYITLFNFSDFYWSENGSYLCVKAKRRELKQPEGGERYNLLPGFSELHISSYITWAALYLQIT